MQANFPAFALIQLLYLEFACAFSQISIERTMKKKALICGFFEPMHQMHLALLRNVQSQGYELVIGLLTRQNSNDSIPASLRQKWLERFGEVVLLPFTKEPYGEIDEVHLPQNISLIAGSNPELLKLASRMKLPHFLWDPAREAWDLRAEDILSHPAEHWFDMPDFVRVDAQKRITFVGPESVGKSWFARAMAEKFGGPHVPEYGRPHEKYRSKGEYTGEELTLLAKRHGASRRALAHLAGAVLFEDTDELMTAIWSEMLLGQSTKSVEALIEKPSLYILYHWDTPWEDDKLRYFSRSDLRKKFHDRIKAKLDQFEMNYIEIGGSWDEREAQTVKAVESLRAEVCF